MWRITGLTAMAMVAFAANSILCRLALGPREIDAASFTSIRVASGAMLLWLIASMRRGGAPGGAEAGVIGSSTRSGTTITPRQRAGNAGPARAENAP